MVCFLLEIFSRATAAVKFGFDPKTLREPTVSEGFERFQIGTEEVMIIILIFGWMVAQLWFVWRFQQLVYGVVFMS